MKNIIFTALVLAIGAGVGLSAILAVMHWRLIAQPVGGRELEVHARMHKATAVTKVGFATTNGILLYALASAGTAENDIRAWFYLLGMLITTVGLAMQVKDIIQTLAKFEVAKDSDKGEVK